MSWISNAWNSAADFVSNAIPNEIKNVVPSELQTTKGLLTSVAGGILLGPAIAPLAGSVGSGIGSVLGAVGADGVASTLGSIAGSTLGSTALGLGVGAAANNIIGNVLGGGSSTKSTPNPQAIGIGTTPSYDDTLLKAFNAQLAIEPQLLAANQLYQPQWLDLQSQNQNLILNKAMEMAKQYYPQAQQIASKYEAGSREAELAQLKNVLPQYQTALSNLTPGYSTALQSAGNLAASAMRMASSNPIEFTDYLSQIPSNIGIPQVQGNQIQKFLD
jgi:hypothetical protein